MLRLARVLALGLAVAWVPTAALAAGEKPKKGGIDWQPYSSAVFERA